MHIYIIDLDFATVTITAVNMTAAIDQLYDQYPTVYYIKNITMVN